MNFQNKKNTIYGDVINYSKTKKIKNNNNKSFTMMFMSGNNKINKKKNTVINSNENTKIDSDTESIEYELLQKARKKCSHQKELYYKAQIELKVLNINQELYLTSFNNMNVSNKYNTTRAQYYNSKNELKKLSDRILKKRFNKALENIDNVNNNKYDPKLYHINMFDKANWNKYIKKYMTFFKNDTLISYNESLEYKYDFSNDIMVFASYPQDYSFIYMINKFLNYGIKKIYFIYSVSDFIDEKFTNLSLFKNDKIHLIEIKNIGYDFNKYYQGIKIIKENNEDYNKVWLINDSFLITKWNFLIYNLVREANNDIIGTFLSYQRKMHLQSYLLIMNSKILEYYYDFLKKFKFIEIKSNRDKFDLIDHLEIGLCNDIINKGVKCGVLFQVKKKPPAPKPVPSWQNNPTTIYGCYSGIIKKNVFFNPILKDLILSLNNNELFLIAVFLLKKVGPNSSITVDLLKKIS